MGTFVDVGVEVAVFLGVRSDLAVVLVNEDAHLRQELHLLLVQVICGYFWHSDG